MIVYIVIYEHEDGTDSIHNVWQKHEHALEEARYMNVFASSGEYVVQSWEVL